MEIRNYSLEKSNGKTIAVATPGLKYYLDSDVWKPLLDNTQLEFKKTSVTAPMASKTMALKMSEFTELENISGEEDFSTNSDDDADIEPEVPNEIDVDFFFNAIVEIDDDIEVELKPRNENIKQAEKIAGVERPYHFVWVDGAEQSTGVIEFPATNYTDVYVVKGSYDNPQIIYIEKDTGVRPYYTQVDGKTYVYMDGFSGAGTSADPWLIESTADLQNIGKADANSANWADGKDASGTTTTKYNSWTMAGYYKLANDIDWATHHATYFNPIGNGAVNAYTTFTGSIDGDGHSVSNINISLTSNGYVGFVSNNVGTIKNLSLTNLSVHGNVLVGGLCGRNYGTGVIDNCSTSGSVSCNSTGCGGLTGYNEAGGHIYKSFSLCNVSGASQTGGLVGANNSSYIANSYSNGNASGTSNVGGFAGQNYQSPITYSYSTGKPVGTSAVGGFVGLSYTGGSYADTNNFYDSDTAETTTSAMGSAKTSTQMKTLSTFSSWNIVLKSAYSDEIWYIDALNDYPRLGWEFESGSIPEEHTGTFEISSTTGIFTSAVKSAFGGISLSASFDILIEGYKPLAAEASLDISAEGSISFVGIKTSAVQMSISSEPSILLSGSKSSSSDISLNSTSDINIDGYKSAFLEADIESSASISFTGVVSTGASGTFDISAETSISLSGNKNSNVLFQIESVSDFESSGNKQVSASLVIPITTNIVFVCRKSAIGVVDITGSTDVVIVGMNGIPSDVDVASINRSVAYLRNNVSKSYLRNNKSNAIIN